MVRDLYADLGFRRIGEHDEGIAYSLNVSAFEPLKTHIEFQKNTP